MEEKKVLLSIKDLEVKFRVRGRVLTAIRGASLDLYENESIAIVGESGSGKSVFTKTFAGMLDSNGFISEGSIVFADEELADTKVHLRALDRFLLKRAESALNRHAKLELGADVWREILALKAERRAKETLSDEESSVFDEKIASLRFERTELYNRKLTVDSKDKEQHKALEAEKKSAIVAHAAAVKSDADYITAYNARLCELKTKHAELVSGEISDETRARNAILAKEIYLSVGRYGLLARVRLVGKLIAALRSAMLLGTDLSDEETRNSVFDNVVFRVRYLDETENTLHGTCILNLAKVKYAKDWYQIRGGKIATVFQDPMTSLNPIITIGKQITSIILKHQRCSEIEARARALELMHKVGIPNPELRFDDYPFQ